MMVINSCIAGHMRSTASNTFTTVPPNLNGTIQSLEGLFLFISVFAPHRVFPPLILKHYHEVQPVAAKDQFSVANLFQNLSSYIRRGPKQMADRSALYFFPRLY